MTKDTPRTDNTDHWRVDRDEADLTFVDAVSADFARELERENARLLTALTEIDDIAASGLYTFVARENVTNKLGKMRSIARKALETE